MLFTLLIVLLFTIGADAYLCFSVLKHCPLFFRLFIWVPTILFYVCFALGMRGNWGWPVTAFIALLICVVLPKAIFCLFSIIGRLGSLGYGPLYGWCSWIGIVIGAIVCIGGVYGVTFGWKHLIVKDEDIASTSLPKSFEGYKIAQITDLHLGTFGSDASYIKRMVDRINSLNPDLIVFTGDLVNFTYKEVEPFKEELSRLHAPDGVLSILGNHDYALYAGAHSDEMSQHLLDSLTATEREMGWRLLLDENIEIHRGNDTIWVAGVQNIGKMFSANRGDLDKALSGIPNGAFTVLLSHDPTHWENAVVDKIDIPLTLSGHTHGMQFKLFGWSPSSFGFKHWGGHYEQDGQHLNVSTGAGGNLPFRFGAWPEIVVLTLK